MTAASPVTYDARLAAQVAAGGGLDVVVNHRWGVRAPQVEGRKVLASGAESYLIVSAGVVLKFGSGLRSKSGQAALLGTPGIQ